MAAGESFNQLKGSKGVEVVRATKAIPFVGSKCEIEEAEQTRKSKFSLKQSLKDLDTAFRDVSTTDSGTAASAVFPTNTSQSKANYQGIARQTWISLSGATANNQLKRLR